VLAGAFDVMDVDDWRSFKTPGRLCVWQAKAHIGARLVGGPGLFDGMSFWTTDRKKPPSL
jgi:hypothetical protein